MEALYFNKLATEKQLELIRTSGTILSRCHIFNTTLKLYKIDHFYAEVKTFKYSGEVISVQAFEDETYLEPYLQAIDISALV